jgi:hypothetical protein
MFKKCLSLFFIGLLIFAANLQTISAQSNTVNSDEGNKVEKIKADVYRRGTGEKSKVVVKLKNGTRHKGYISQTIEDSFDLTDAKTKQTTTIPYRDVAQVKKQGWSKGTKIALGVGIAAVVVTAVVIGVALRDPLGDFCPLGCGPF